MDATITGALIAGGAALIGYGASALNTRSTVRANREVAREQRVWEKKTELYESIYRTLGDLYPAASVPEIDAVCEKLRSYAEQAWLYATDEVGRLLDRTVSQLGESPVTYSVEGLLSQGVAADLLRALRADVQHGPPTSLFTPRLQAARRFSASARRA